MSTGPQCSRGWGKRCPAARGRKCTCRCGGANHGLGDMGENEGRATVAGTAPRARFRIEEDGARVVLRDLGPWDQHPTVTNDAEAVVASLARMLGARHLYYYDSEGRLDELLHDHGRFTGFRAGTRAAAVPL